MYLVESSLCFRFTDLRKHCRTASQFGRLVILKKPILDSFCLMHVLTTTTFGPGVQLPSARVHVIHMEKVDPVSPL